MHRYIVNTEKTFQKKMSLKFYTMCYNQGALDTKTTKIPYYVLFLTLRCSKEIELEREVARAHLKSLFWLNHLSAISAQITGN